jgi:uncharacterized membrane protein YcjF (UPF0283 family)
MDIENLLYDEIATDFKKLQDENLEPEKRKVMVDELAKFMDRAIEMKRLENDYKEKVEARMSEEKEKAEARLSTQAIELQKLEEDRKDRIVKNILGAAGIVLPLAVTIWGTKVSMAFEKEDTFTTIMGRGFVNKLFFRK